MTTEQAGQQGSNTSGNKYELTEETRIVAGVTLYRIRALRAFANIRAGDIGGWVGSEKNLSQEGEAWVHDEACVYSSARVRGDANVCERARVYGGAQVSGKASVRGDASVCESALVYGTARVSEDAKVFNAARVHGDARVQGSAKVHGNANIHGDALVGGRARVGATVVMSGTVQDKPQEEETKTQPARHTDMEAIIAAKVNADKALKAFCEEHSISEGDLGITTLIIEGDIIMELLFGSKQGGIRVGKDHMQALCDILHSIGFKPGPLPAKSGRLGSR